MCGIAGAVSLTRSAVPRLERALAAMNHLIAHRGPDGEGVWRETGDVCGLAHRRLAIIDLSASGHQPMIGSNGSALSFNGEIYNYRELMAELKDGWDFRSSSDTETILAAYAKWGTDCLSHLRGMFAFALWDGDRLFAARDRFGIKPIYYAVIDGVFYFASEMKALLPFLPEIATDADALAEYMAFQYTIGEQTLFKHIHTLLPGHALTVQNGEVRVFRYWDVHYEIDWDHSARWFGDEMRARLSDSINVHLRSDVPVGAYVSGGIDSSLIAILASREEASGRIGFHGKFTEFEGYDESAYAEAACSMGEIDLRQIEITANDFRENIENVIYHLDTPVAGPGSFPQYMVSKLAAQHVKVVLGGQGGDEIFGGYARYLIAYLEQSLKAAIDGTYKNGNFVVTPKSIIPNLTVLREYKPLIRQLFSSGLFGPLDERYFRLIDRSADMADEVDWSSVDREAVFSRFQAIFNSERNVKKEAYFDSMTHFDFKCLLPALLQVEDRMSMAHGLESRVPLLDHSVVEFAATMPANIKFKGGRMKHFVKSTFADDLPGDLVKRRDKMGFPVPLKEWFSGELNGMVADIFQTQKRRHREFFNSDVILAGIGKGEQFSRKTWGLLCLELWHQRFHDRANEYKRLIDTDAASSFAA
ncbi:asparagine synthase (glutamine-hydrolyzing) [Bosea sp. (in: a-proteobacteria)]|uniref:asparagine synthase (glutamine-hydrolyzing) n=1 Tax=Bosea sp. (in: a-proteobacteria) TaxID=1871050 RepID=UPI001218D798|nr:asparagine synthase (glutamine-hydrolyzing) [Bosea sp. (in: a-proteobacteria)]TAJ27527.1 MAG: asparagine synthase (glutamine-hydrolyzing) [Bosea sp. (in: a-proteobacteria)]